jgi:putative glutathione S-transferase
MGFLIDGKWQDKWFDTEKSKGEFIREKSQFRNWITKDGNDGNFKAESGRYHLYVSFACPWAHRTLIFRQLKDLQPHISVNVVHPHMLHNGWEFSVTDPALQDSLLHCRYLYEIYLKASPQYSGRATVPVLWDKKQNTIVNNESSEIIRMLNNAFNEITGDDKDFYPQQLREEIDNINAFVYENINNGVYRVGFATTQEAYDQAFDLLFAALDKIEQRLDKQDFLVQNTLTEADWRLFTTLIRFDAVYYSHFKCNLRQLRDCRNIDKYLKRLYHMPKIADTVNFYHIKQHYYFSQTTINPTQIVPKGPILHLG